MAEHFDGFIPPLWMRLVHFLDAITVFAAGLLWSTHPVFSLIVIWSGLVSSIVYIYYPKQYLEWRYRDRSTSDIPNAGL